MNLFRDLRVSAKLLSGFGVVAVMIVIVGWLGVHNLGVLDDRIKEMFEEEFQPSLAVSDLQTLLYQLRSNTWQVVATTDADGTKALVSEGYALDRTARKDGEALVPKLRSGELREKFT